MGLSWRADQPQSFASSLTIVLKHHLTFLSMIFCVGPTLHPTLYRILLKFRTYRVALTADISKMYREVQLSNSDKQLHRLLWQANTSDPIRDYCTNRVTFGIAASPYLAVRTLQQAAIDQAHPYFPCHALFLCG